MSNDDEDDERPTREEILEQYGWKDDAERAEAYAEVERRQRQIDREAREAAAREAQVRNEIIAAGRPPVMTKSYSVPVAAAAAEPDWDAWRKFILATVRKQKYVDDEMLGKVIKHLGEQITDWDEEVCKATKEAREKALEPLRAEIEQLRAEIAELRALRSKPATVDEERQRAGEIRRQRQKLAQLQVA